MTRECGEGFESILDDNLWDRQIERMLDDEQRGPVLNGRGSEEVPIGHLSTHREEDRAGLDETRIGLHLPRDDRLGHRDAAQLEHAGDCGPDFGQGSGYHL